MPTQHQQAPVRRQAPKAWPIDRASRTPRTPQTARTPRAPKRETPRRGARQAAPLPAIAVEIRYAPRDPAWDEIWRDLLLGPPLMMAWPAPLPTTLPMQVQQGGMP